MFPQPKEASYVEGLNQLLLDSVPDDALVVVETGCAEGRLGAELKNRVPGRRVIGIEIDEDAAAKARELLDEVLVHDLMAGPPAVPPGTVDAVLFGDVLEHVVDPEAVLVDTRTLLAPGGRVLASIPNIGHFSVLRPLLRGDFMYQPEGQLDATHLRFFTYATIWKLFLDAGYLPRLVTISEAPAPEALITALTPALAHHQVDVERARPHLGAFQYIVEGTALPERPAGYAAPITFAYTVSDVPQVRSNLLRSPILAAGSPHQLIEVTDCDSAAAALEAARAQAEHDIVVLVGQDVYLPRGWDHAFRASWDAACTAFGELGVAGLRGVREQDGTVTEVGRLVEHADLVDAGVALPAAADSLDDLLIAVPKETPLRADPALGFHLYGADLALRARAAGLPVVVLDAPALHNSLAARPDDAFHASREHLLATWQAQRPLRTSAGVLDDLTPTPAPVLWPTAQNREIHALTGTIRHRDEQLAELRARFDEGNARQAELTKQLAAQREQVERADARLARIESSRTWRARGVARRAAGRVARRIKSAG